MREATFQGSASFVWSWAGHGVPGLWPGNSSREPAWVSPGGRRLSSLPRTLRPAGCKDSPQSSATATQTTLTTHTILTVLSEA